MRRFFTTILVALAATTLMAQVQIWYNGSVVYEREYALIDSITFGLPTEPPTPDPDSVTYPTPVCDDEAGTINGVHYDNYIYKCWTVYYWQSETYTGPYSNPEDNSFEEHTDLYWDTEYSIRKMWENWKAGINVVVSNQYLTAVVRGDYTITLAVGKEAEKCAPIVIADGMYIVGPATAVADMNDVDNLSKVLMTVGINEANKQTRDGMYEKYIALEANKEFSIVYHQQGSTNVVYGAALMEKEAVTDNAEEQIMIYWGQLQENVTMTVPKSGLYHVIVDLNKDGALTYTGGAQIAIVPVAWGIRGSLTSWSYTLPATSTSVFDKEHMASIWKGVEVKKDEKFVFISQDCWKIQLDMGGNVKAETRLGMKNGEMNNFEDGIDIPLTRGIWTLELAWDLNGGSVGESFTYTATKTAEVEMTDYSNCEVELVGDAVANQEGATPDPSIWNWGNVLSMGTPTRDGNVFTWKKENVKMVSGEFKVRSTGYTVQGDIEPFDNGSNLSITTAGTYTIIFTLNAETFEKNVTIARTDY